MPSENTMTIPIVLTAAGRQPQSPATLNAQIIAQATALSPGLTANLPGSLIEDISSTDTAAALVCDSAVTELINSVTPYGANLFILNQLANVYLGQLNGFQGAATTTSVYVVFTGPAGFVIPVGFTVSDGTYQYTVQDGGIIGASGQSAQLFCLAALSGSWAVPVGTVTQLITSVPSGITLTVTNPAAGVPGAGAESEEAYRARVLQAGIVSAQGTPTYLKALLGQVSGVQPNLISIQQQTAGGWEVVCGGGDPYQIGYAIYSGLFDISLLVGSQLAVIGISNANPGVATTNLPHGLTTGSVITLTNVNGMTGINGVPLTVTVLTSTTFSIGVNTTSSGSYVSGGTMTPNPRNITVSINDYPDTYNVTFVNPVQQTVTMTVTWNSTATNVVAPAAIAQLAQQPLANYVNSLPVGVPMNQFELQTVFQAAIATAVTPQLLTRLIFQVFINGTLTSPTAGTGIIAGDPEGYFYTTAASINVVKG
jgi:hypothetical protein